MRPLNENFDFKQLPKDKRMEVLNAFLGTPRKETFPVGTHFYRFVTPKKGEHAPLLGNAILTAEWWFGEGTRSKLSRISYRGRTPLAHSARSRLSVTSAFNREMEYLCRVIVVAPICGWVGNARWQHEIGTKVFLPGGAEQVYFPSLGTNSNGLYSDAVRLDMWAYLDDAL
jgi:hypothetical protein